MLVTFQTFGNTLLATLKGRLDAHGSEDVLSAFHASPGGSSRNLILSLDDVPYVSSAALRIFLQFRTEASRQGGKFALAGLQPYCREVLRIAGLESMLTIYPTTTEALAEMETDGQVAHREDGVFHFLPGSGEPGGIKVLGHINDVLASRITKEHLRSKPFSATEYSLGLGGLGPTDEDVLPLIGEMMTVGGTMVWLPTDGNDTPDFLTPKGESDLVQIRTGFNAALFGPFNEFVHFTSASANGTTLTDLYRALFDAAKVRRADFRGAIGTAMRADVQEMYGSGVRLSPILENAPKNGKWITDPENFATWFEFDEVPRRSEVTGLISGVGLDLSADLDAYEQSALDATFYRNPANRPAKDCMLHNHGVFFSPLPFPDPPRDLETEIADVVEVGDFVDMRHLLDRTTITRALIGLIYVQDFRLNS
jgi:anti-anti-sigma factor